MLAEQIDQEWVKKAERLAAQVGNTPLIRLKNMEKNKGVEIWAKLEWEQLSGSVKCRAAYFIILDALKKGLLQEQMTLLDATSGNTGIAYAAIGAELGIRVTLCLPENASPERKQILRSLGAETIFTSRFEGTDGAQEAAKELADRFPGKYYYANQYQNENNWKAHYHTTAAEIFSQLPSLTHFATGLGTTGTFIGTGRRLKELKPSIRLVAFQPNSALHGLEGWKHLETALVPSIYDPLLADQQEEVDTEEAYTIIRDAKEKQGLLLSPSSAANITGALRLAQGMSKGVVVTMLPDSGDRYTELIKKILPNDTF